MELTLSPPNVIQQKQPLTVTDKAHGNASQIFEELDDQWRLLTELKSRSSSNSGKRAYIYKFKELLDVIAPVLENSETLPSLVNSPLAELGRRLLMENRELFYSLYRDSTNNFEPPLTNVKLNLPKSAAKFFYDSLPSIDTQHIHRTVEEIRTTGICIWRNFIRDSSELESFRTGTKKTIGNMKILLRGRATKSFQESNTKSNSPNL